MKVEYRTQRETQSTERKEIKQNLQKAKQPLGVKRWNPRKEEKTTQNVMY